jgi:folate-binding protein YgfZ
MMQQPLFLSSRTIISVSGADAESFLNGILTASTLGLEDGVFRYGALLTPQGKVIADALITRSKDAFLLDCAANAAPALVKRLTLMMLRAAVSIGERADLGVAVFDGSPDPRSEHAPRRRIVTRAESADPAPYHAARIAAGLAEQDADFSGEEVFPADINMDLIGGVDFKKGCFVGQEVVSRMKRRGSARRRTLKAEVAAGAQAGTPVLAGDFEIGLLTSISGGAALARVRIDRLMDAEAKGDTLTAAGAPIVFDRPAWLADELVALAEAREAKA